jgi:hypothetical protein
MNDRLDRDVAWTVVSAAPAEDLRCGWALGGPALGFAQSEAPARTRQKKMAIQTKTILHKHQVCYLIILEGVCESRRNEGQMRVIKGAKSS